MNLHAAPDYWHHPTRYASLNPLRCVDWATSSQAAVLQRLEEPDADVKEAEDVEDYVNIVHAH